MKVSKVRKYKVEHAIGILKRKIETQRNTAKRILEKKFKELKVERKDREALEVKINLTRK